MIDDINKKHERLGVHWSYWVGSKTSFTLIGFHRHKDGYYKSLPPCPRYKGLGEACLRELTEVADERGYTIHLWCNQPKLFPMYLRCGFEITEKYEPDPNYCKATFVRKPRTCGNSTTWRTLSAHMCTMSGRLMGRKH